MGDKASSGLDSGYATLILGKDSSMLDASAGTVAVARTVLIHGPLSRTDLINRLGLSPATLTRFSKPLLDSGFLVEVGELSSTSRGRPVRPLDITPNAGQFVGIKLTGDRLYAVMTNVRADTLNWLENDLVSRDPEAVIGQIEQAVRHLNPSQLIGVGVSLGGLVRSGLVQFASFLGWNEVDLAGLLEQRLGTPVSIENDLVALAEAERWFGLGRGEENFLVVTIGAGTGYAVVSGDHVIRNPDSGIGTAGHIRLVHNGPPCPLGHPGCSQAVLTIDAIINQVHTRTRHTMSFAEIVRLAGEGDHDVLAVLDNVGNALGLLIASACNFSLQASVVLAGEGLGIYPFIADRVTSAITAHRDPYARPVVVHVDDSGFVAWARGAASLAIQSAMEQVRITNEPSVTNPSG